MSTSRIVSLIGMLALVLATILLVANAAAYSGSESGYYVKLVVPEEHKDTAPEDDYRLTVLASTQTAGFLRTESGYNINLNLYPSGVGGSYNESGLRLYLVPEQAYISHWCEIPANDPDCSYAIFPDTDGDGISDAAEGTGDTDGDGLPDWQDPDDDGDGVPTARENPDPNGDGDPSDAQDTDRDGTPDFRDDDDDGDGISTAQENPDPNGDGNPSDAQDTDGDGIPDFRDPDDDGDGIPTADEDMNRDGDPTNDDTNGNGIPNYIDPDDRYSIRQVPAFTSTGLIALISALSAIAAVAIVRKRR